MKKRLYFSLKDVVELKLAVAVRIKFLKNLLSGSSAIVREQLEKEISDLERINKDLDKAINGGW